MVGLLLGALAPLSVAASAVLPPLLDRAAFSCGELKVAGAAVRVEASGRVRAAATTANEVEVLALEKRHITAPETTFRFEVSGTPLRAGIDPCCKLVDRDSNDNLRRVTSVGRVGD